MGSNGRKPRRRNCGLAPGSSFLLMSSLSLFCILCDKQCILNFCIGVLYLLELHLAPAPPSSSYPLSPYFVYWTSCTYICICVHTWWIYSPLKSHIAILTYSPICPHLCPRPLSPWLASSRPDPQPFLPPRDRTAPDTFSPPLPPLPFCLVRCNLVTPPQHFWPRCSLVAPSISSQSYGSLPLCSGSCL